MEVPIDFEPLGFVGFTYTGEYDNNHPYVQNDLVKYDSGIWMCQIDDTRGITPIEGTVWTKWVQGADKAADIVVTDKDGNQTNLQDLINKIENNVETNTETITNHEIRITNNTNNITTLTNQVNINKINIESNKLAIDDLKQKVQTNSNNIQLNTDNISINTGAINDNTSNIKDLKNRVNDNEQIINDLSTKVETNTNNITSIDSETKILRNTLYKHINDDIIPSENGAHNFRYYEEKLQIYKYDDSKADDPDYDGEWETIATKGGGTLKKTIVTSLPTVGETDTIYLIKDQTVTTKEVYNQWMYIDNKWADLGNTDIDLSNYQLKLKAGEGITIDPTDNTISLSVKLIAGDNITITDNADGSKTISASLTQKSNDFDVGGPINLKVERDNRDALLTWEDPDVIYYLVDVVTKFDETVQALTTGKWKGTLIVRKEGSAPESITDGMQVLDNQESNKYQFDPYHDPGLEPGKTYYYRVYCYDDNGNYTSGKVARIVIPAMAVIRVNILDTELIGSIVNISSGDTMTWTIDDSLTHDFTITELKSYAVSDTFTGNSQIVDATDYKTYEVNIGASAIVTVNFNLDDFNGTIVTADIDI